MMIPNSWKMRRIAGLIGRRMDDAASGFRRWSAPWARLLPGEARAAFTLIEMLVVIAILGTLLALLVPGLHRATAAGRSTVCRTNLRQIGQAMMMHVVDRQGYLPWHGDPRDFGRPPGSGALQSSGCQWDVQIMSYLNINWTWGSMMPPPDLGGHPTVFYCPGSDPFIPVVSLGQASYVRSLSYNYNQEAGRNVRGTRNLELIEDPAHTLLIIDAVHSADPDYVARFGSNRATGLGRGHTNTSTITEFGFLTRGQFFYRHDRHANILLADMRVDSRPVGPTGRPSGIRMYNGGALYP